MRTLFVATILAFSLLACKKENKKAETEENIAGEGIEGTWELSETYGGMSPYTEHPPGNGNLLQFDQTSYKIYTTLQVMQQGTYQLINDSVTNLNTCVLEPAATSEPNRLVLDNEVFLRRSFSITGSTLSIASGCIPLDGGVAKYRRVQAPK
jgi:hypothetical protein